MYSIIRRILGQMRNDKRSLAMIFLAPIFVLSILYVILGDSNYKPRLGVYQIPDVLVTNLEEKLEVIKGDSKPFLPDELENESLDGFLWNDKNGLHLYLTEQNTKTAKVVKSIQEASKVKDQMSVEYQYETAADNQLDSLSFVFLGILSFFFVFILSGMSFVSERTTQTLERMLMAPLSRISVIGGYTIGYGILSALQSIVIILFTAFVLKLHFEGSILLCILIMIVMSFAAVVTGALLSLFANNEFQMVQFIPVIIIPQIFYSGLIPLDTIPFGLGKLCYFTPAYYGCSSLQNVMIYGYGLEKVWPWLTGLICYIGVLFILNVLALKKYRKL